MKPEYNVMHEKRIKITSGELLLYKSYKVLLITECSGNCLNNFILPVFDYGDNIWYNMGTTT